MDVNTNGRQAEDCTARASVRSAGSPQPNRYE